MFVLVFVSGWGACVCVCVCVCLRVCFPRILRPLRVHRCSTGPHGRGWWRYCDAPAQTLELKSIFPVHTRPKPLTIGSSQCYLLPTFTLTHNALSLSLPLSALPHTQVLVYQPPSSAGATMQAQGPMVGGFPMQPQQQILAGGGPPMQSAQHLFQQPVATDVAQGWSGLLTSCVCVCGFWGGGGGGLCVGVGGCL